MTHHNTADIRAHSSAHSHRVRNIFAYRKVCPTGAEFGDSDSYYTPKCLYDAI